MNKMHTIARVAARIFGVYLLISFVPYVFSMLVSAPVYLFQAEWMAMIPMLGSMVVSLCFIGFVSYYLIRRSDRFARKIVGQDQNLPDSLNPAAWYPFALRLAVIIAGLLFLQKAVLSLSSLAYCIRFTFQSNTFEGAWQMYEYGIYFLIYLAISIYLLAGAPQFVRWQVKKTAQLCKEFPEK